MLISKTLLRVNILLFSSLCFSILPGCGGGNGSKINNDNVTYIPETRPLGVIAGADIEAPPGMTVVLGGRLVGTVTTEKVMWELLGGDTIEGINNWNTPNLTFVAPAVEGIKKYTFRITALSASNEPLSDKDGNLLTDEVSVVVFDPAAMINIEVEDTNFVTLSGVELINQGHNNYIIDGASGQHTNDFLPSTYITYTIPSGSLVDGKTLSAGYYYFYMNAAVPATGYGASKVANVIVNGVESELVIYAGDAFNKYSLGVIKLEEGNNTIKIGGGWDYYRVDSIKLLAAPKPAKPQAVPTTLINENATKATQDLMTFLVGSYGSKTLSGQTEYMDYNDLSNKTGLRDFNKVTEMTGGQSPAIVAFDLMDYSSSRINCGAEPGFLSEDMIAEHNTKNVILSPLWHWNSPTKLKDSTCSGSGNTAWYSGFYTTGTNFNLKTALADTNSADYQALISDMDDIAAELKKFADADIPLLWRPLHEAEGAWFWWGASDAASFKALWEIMYQRFTEVHQLNNLIWVYTAAGNLSNDWYPGDDYVDVVGYDGYDGNNANNPFKTQFNTLRDRFDGKKLVALTEVGTIPNVSLLQEQNAWWAYFVTWNSEGSTEYGPVNADATAVKAAYEFEGTLNLDDVPGGRTKVEAGLYESFELPVPSGWGAQINWSDVSGAGLCSAWSTNNGHALSVTKDLSAETNPTSVVLQTYPSGGIDITGKQKLRLTGYAANAGASTTAKLWIKYGDSSEWKDAGAISANGEVALEIDITDLNLLKAIGVQFEGFNAASTNATFAIDTVMLDSSVIYDFEPSTAPWGAQVNWGDTNGATLSTNWKNTGNRSLGITKDLSAETAPTSVILQTYPAGGIDITGKTTLTLAAYTAHAGAGTTAKLWIKHGESQTWKDAGAIAASGAVNLSIDITGLNSIAAIGVQFEGFDASSTAAEFYIDTVKIDNQVKYDFEGTNTWEFQRNWSPEAGIRLANDWVKSGALSLSGALQLQAGDDDIVLQTYLNNEGILLGDVTTLKISAHAENSGTATKAQLWAKDKDGGWKDGGAVDLINGSAELSLDISSMGGELSAFGVRFMGANNTTSESSYYIDDVSFE